MKSVVNSLNMLATCISERAHHGLSEVVGPVDREALFILDGVGAFQAAPLMVRKALRDAGSDMGTILVRWQTGPPGQIWTDLMWLRRNQLMGGKLARRLLAFRRAQPDATIHILAFSGGAGIALFACEKLRGRPLVETLILACPAVSPGYNLGPAMRSIKRCYGLISRRDWLILGLGTGVFGTTDRSFSRAAGLRGFRLPGDASDADLQAYERIRQIHWSPVLKAEGHFGGHVGWGSVPFLYRHLPDMLRGTPTLPVTRVTPTCGTAIPGDRSE
jgi:pimeloyl-ACP methyl ester carboxylesterase